MFNIVEKFFICVESIIMQIGEQEFFFKVRKDSNNVFTGIVNRWKLLKVPIEMLTLKKNPVKGFFII